ncbi:selenoprotein O and cysteine-containing homologs [Paenibacillus sp. JCM 10914]|nr:selenoprotein O and cysteine-containing homologs [Paenibacillus sp. JCM 10914]
MMKEYHADYTNTFRELTLARPEATPLFGTSEFGSWHARWQARVAAQPEGWKGSQLLMKRTNPAVIPRNHRVEEALAAAEDQGDYQVMERLLEVLLDPYAYSPEQAEYASIPAAKQPYRTYCGT